jgi:cobaltochelatase CobN
VYEQMSRVIRGLLDGACPEWLDPAYAAFVRRVTDRIHGSDECGGLLRALEGRYVSPACGGDPIRDPDVYPTGKSMYAFDPRRVPTAAADARGKKAAAGLLEHYYANHGAYPETVGVVLWGFETMKTGGDTIAQILSLLGVRIVHKKSLWQKELEVIPLEALGRPRVDVLITMCGIFRDTFGSHIDLINRAVALAAGLDEPPEQNFIRRHVCEQPEERRQDIPLRMFGPSPTEYATSLTTLIETGSWDAESELGGAFFESMSYAYDGEGRAQKSPEMLSGLMSSVDMVTQERDSVEYDITDLDHYYEFLGGLSRAVQDKRDGQRADVLVVDQTEGEPEVSELKTALERGTRSRTLNPRWVEGMLKHDFHGAKKVKDRVEYLLGFAATTGSVDSWVFDEVADRLVLDEDMLEKLQKNNPYAAKQMAETLIESEHRGYWDADEERLKKLRNLVLSMESDVE